MAKFSFANRIVRNGFFLVASGLAAIYWIADYGANTQGTIARTFTVSLVIVYGGLTQYLLNSRKEALEEKERTQAQLIQSESLAAIGQLTAGVAHELNNPLASTSSFIQTDIDLINEQEEKRPADRELLENLEFSLKELKRAKNIVKSVMDLSRQTQTYEEEVNINSVIEDALRVLYNQYKYSQVSIERHFQPDLPPIKGNFANLGQVFINIIKNAVQAIPNGTGRIVLTTRRGQNGVVAECTDNGSGIDPGIQKDIFKPFFTTKQVGEGMGLGLYLSHEIVKKHGGAISVESRPGEGSTFRIELPIRRQT